MAASYLTMIHTTRVGGYLYRVSVNIVSAAPTTQHIRQPGLGDFSNTGWSGRDKFMSTFITTSQYVITIIASCEHLHIITLSHFTMWLSVVNNCDFLIVTNRLLIWKKNFDVWKDMVKIVLYPSLHQEVWVRTECYILYYNTNTS